MASFSIDAILGNSEPKHEDSSLLETQDLLNVARGDESSPKGIDLHVQSPLTVNESQ